MIKGMLIVSHRIVATFGLASLLTNFSSIIAGAPDAKGWDMV